MTHPKQMNGGEPQVKGLWIWKGFSCSYFALEGTKVPRIKMIYPECYPGMGQGNVVEVTSTVISVHAFISQCPPENMVASSTLHVWKRSWESVLHLHRSCASCPVLSSNRSLSPIQSPTFVMSLLCFICLFKLMCSSCLRALRQGIILYKMRGMGKAFTPRWNAYRSLPDDLNLAGD